MRGDRRFTIEGFTLALAMLAAGCTSGVTPPPSTATSSARAEATEPVQPRPHDPAEGVSHDPQGVSDTPKSASAPKPVESSAETRRAEGAYGVKMIEIETHTEEPDEAPASLHEAAQLAREKRAAEGAPVAVITNETLPDYATGELSEGIARPIPPDAEVGETTAAAGGTATPPGVEGSGEEYWRDRVRTARLDWRDLEVEVTDLENRVSALRRQFYAEDDGFYRDSQIKPAWDRALDRLGEVRQQVSVAQAGLAEIIQEGRSAGALPGWLREGAEYEPATPEVEDELETHEAMEPVIIDGDGGGARP